PTVWLIRAMQRPQLVAVRFATLRVATRYLFFLRKEKVTEKKSPAYVFFPMSLQVARCEKELGQFHWPQTLFSRRSLLYAITAKILLRFLGLRTRKPRAGGTRGGRTTKVRAR
ncbi:MAG: hypothetical protein K2L79_05335, partial [Bacteroidales bacterium]|nr:hypothetical protein [Bacteroidales bacterium]